MNEAPRRPRPPGHDTDPGSSAVRRSRAALDVAPHQRRLARVIAGQANRILLKPLRVLVRVPRMVDGALVLLLELVARHHLRHEPED